MIFMVKKPGFLGGQHNLCFWWFWGAYGIYIWGIAEGGDNKLIDENGAVVLSLETRISYLRKERHLYQISRV